MTNTKFKRPRALVRCVALLAIAITVAACADRAGEAVNKQASYDQQLRELLQRPDINDAVSRYDRMRADISDRIAAEIGLSPWKKDNGTRAGCREFPDVDDGEKESAQLGTWFVGAAIPDDKWPQAVAIFSEITSKYGFESPPRVLVDRPGNHEVTAADPWGADATLGTEVGTILGLLTGCHPTATGRMRHAPTTSSSTPT